MTLVSRQMTSRGETHRRFLQRIERKEINMAIKLKKQAEPEKKAPAEQKKSTRLETPVKPADRDGDRYGATLGLRLDETFVKVLVDNEDPKKGHKTDEQLMEFLLKEFPNRHNKGILYNVREIRWRYNFGRFTSEDRRTPPDLISVRYAEDGTPFQKKSTKTGESEEEKAMKLEDRKKAEAARREEEDSKISKSQERHDALVAKMTERRANWETKNGPLQDNQPVAKKPEGKKFKKA
jgi:hypothetical protein